MGRRGPAPAPTKLKLLRGDSHLDRINTDEPMPPSGLPECPSTVAPDVREIWDYCLHNLDVMGIVSPADRDTLLAFCEAVSLHRKASAILAKSPILIQGHRGVMVRNPAISAQTHAAAVIRALSHEFGFSPSARSEINTGAASKSATGAERYLTG